MGLLTRGVQRLWPAVGEAAWGVLHSLEFQHSFRPLRTGLCDLMGTRRVVRGQLCCP